MDKATKIPGKAIALASKYTSFDPADPGATPAHELTLTGLDRLDESGDLTGYFAEEGYVLVGRATVEIEFLPAKDMTIRAVASLKSMKAAVLAKAEAEATGIERQIQSLLAITHEA